MSAPDPSQIAAWLATAAEILDGASEQFVAGHRADSAVAKKGNDFATEVDLAIERQVVAELTRLTGIGVHGEEFGGEPIDSELVWVLDPIDGTFNYAAGSPMAAMLLGLLWEGEPLLGLTWLPFTGQRYTSMPGGPLRCNAEALEPLTASTLSDSIVGIGTFNIDSRGTLPGPLPGGGPGRPQQAVLAGSHARRHRNRPRLRGGRNPRWGNQLRPSHLGPRRGGGADSCGRRNRHRPGR